jgi:hypothetical protein
VPRDTGDSLLFGANYDVAIDAGIISFDDNKALLCRPLVNLTELLRAGINTSARLRTPRKETLPYLDFHHRNLVRSAPA